MKMNKKEHLIRLEPHVVEPQFVLVLKMLMVPILFFSLALLENSR
jgi:hypothetical protein